MRDYGLVFRSIIHWHSFFDSKRFSSYESNLNLNVPIYGAAAFLRPIYRLTKNRNILFRGGIYTCCIFLTEYISGSLLKKKGICPWDYSGTPLNIGGLIRLDYAPFWFGAGLCLNV